VEIERFLNHHNFASQIIRMDNGDPIAAIYLPEDWMTSAADKERAKIIINGMVAEGSKLLLIMNHAHAEGFKMSVDYFEKEEDLISALINATPDSYKIWKGDRLKLALVKGK